MPREVLIFLHMEDDHPGYIADYLSDRAIPFRVIRRDRGEPIPGHDASMAGLVFMGGTMSANDDISWIHSEIALIKQALEARTPLLGHCLGGQLISRALGQSVRKNPVEEVGWHPCTAHDNPAARHWLGAVGNPFPMFHWHNETFDLPTGGELLFSTEFCRNQAYAYGQNVLAMQCHVEMTEALVYQWIDHGEQSLQRRSASEQDYEQIRSATAAAIPALNRVADQLYGRWVETLTL